MERRGQGRPDRPRPLPELGVGWPVNRRIVYNRASVDQNGKPWDPKRALLKWVPDWTRRRSRRTTGAPLWAGDVVDGGYPPLAGREGTGSCRSS